MTYNVLKKPDVFYIGKQDENSAETIDIDYSAWIERYGEGIITATFQGAEDADPYDIVLTTANGIATWTVTDANTVAAGVGKLQLNYVVDEVVAKSLIWTVRVYPSMRATGEAPDGYQDWLTALQGLSAETQQNAQDAANSATEAEEYAEQAKESADSITGLTVEAETLPAGSSATASFDAATDKLSLGIPRGDKGEKGDAGQDGITPDLTMGTTETLPAGSSATATITGTKENPVLNLGIPQGIQGVQGERGGKGDTGATPDISIGTVETLNPDESAAATITGTAENPVLNLGIPKGETGSAGSDGFSPSASVTKQDGNIVITVTDKDGTTSETLEVDDALDETSVNPVQNAAIVAAMRSMFPVDTASGAIASFPDGANDVPMLSIKAQIEPVQDLHGYDSPWPEGGGKNLLPYASKDTDSKNGVTWTKNSDGSIAFSGTCSVSVAMAFAEFELPAGDYLFSNVGSTFAYTGGNRPTVYVRDLDNALSLANFGFGQSANGLPFSLSATTNIRFYAVFQTDNVVSGVLYPMIRLATETDATFAPYSNICPITGFEGAEIRRTGKNLFDKNNYGVLNAYMTNSSFVSSMRHKTIYIPCMPNTTYVASNSANNRSVLAWTDTVPAIGATYYGGTSTSITTGATAKYLVSYCFNENTDSATFQQVLDSIQIELGSTATDYEPYSGNTYDITFPSEAGTVYGGTLDVVTGVLTVTMARIVLDGTQNLRLINWRPGANSVGWAYYYTLTNNKRVAFKEIPNLLSDALPTKPYESLFSDDTGGVGVYSENSDYGLFVRMADTTLTNAAAINSYLAANPIEVVYELATPQTYQLTPEEVATFLGTNNIWADVGDTSVTYRADIGKYIEKKVNG